MSAVDWRNNLRREMQKDLWTNLFLEEYKANRENPLWRTAASIEHLCEYILYLEDKLNAKQSDTE